MSTEDRKRVRYALRRIAEHDFEALRTAALVMLAWGSGLRLSECVSLDVDQVEARRHHIQERISLRGQQVKGGLENGQAVHITIPPAARSAIRRYLIEARRREWIGKAGPLFVARWCRGRPGEHPRLHKRSAQSSWRRLQIRAGIEPTYRFHDIRHDSITVFAQQCNGDTFRVQEFARHKFIETTVPYVHPDMNDVAVTAEAAERNRYS